MGILRDFVFKKIEFENLSSTHVLMTIFNMFQVYFLENDALNETILFYIFARGKIQVCLINFQARSSWKRNILQKILFFLFKIYSFFSIVYFSFIFNSMFVYSRLFDFE